MLIYTLLVCTISLVSVISGCPPGKKTDKVGRCCVFPFTYRGVSYNSCTTVANGNRPWCSFDSVYNGQWANCVNPCTNNPCKNGGSCSTVTGEDSYSCQCAEVFYGDSCEKVSPCKSGPCKNGGSCTMTGPDSFSCTCTEEFEGSTCEKKLPCPPGKKTDKVGRCCVFPFTYRGVSYDSCTTVANGNRPWCSFDAVYRGQWANCVDECADSPCMNGASCKTTQDGYSCQPCPVGWQGKDCDQDINECESTSCTNGGTCLNQPGTFSCACKKGYTGQHCEEDIDECASSPCVNGGKCKDEVGQYLCECPAGYEGANCETDIDECKDDPCENGGTCVNSPPGSYTCNCAEGYKGDHCQEVDWKSEGCYNEKARNRRLLKKTYKIVQRNKDDIEEVFNKCRTFAEIAGYEIFAIKGASICVTSENGKMVDFKTYGASSNCKTDDDGNGVGLSKDFFFVYTR